MNSKSLQDLKDLSTKINDNKELVSKLNDLRIKYSEIIEKLENPDVYKDRRLSSKLHKERAKLEKPVEYLLDYNKLLTNITETKNLIQEGDKDIKLIAEDDLNKYISKKTELENKIMDSLVEKDTNDEKDIFLEIRAGTGGDEAAIFAGDLYKMYMKFFEKSRWTTELLNINESDHGGYKEIVLKVLGSNVFSYLKFESGTHRVQRVPETETQGRIHTSAATVAILPIADDIDNIDINPSDLRIDTYRASGAGGQHVNKTDSAVRITHLPTGIVSECQEDRSQHKNKAKAMSYLNSRIMMLEKEKQKATTDKERKNQVGSGDRSERIRTYNFPQGRLTDHRINLTMYKLESILDGNIEPLLEELKKSTLNK